MLLGQQCNLWGKGSLLTRLTSQVRGAACPLMSFLRTLQLLLPLQGGYDRPASL